MLIRLLGPIEVTGDAAIRFAGLRRKAVLTMLALHRGEVVGSDLLIDILWGDSPPENPANALQRHISYLRRVLADRDAIVARPPGYVLNVARGCIDVERVEDLRCASRLETDPIAAERLLAEAHRMWRGRAMAELDGLPGMASAIEQVRQLQLSIAQELVELRIILGHHVDVIPALKSLLAEFPLQEHLHALLIVALYGSGRQADALAAHRAARRLIVEELGVDPGRELEGLESAILRGDELQTIAGILTRVAHRSTARQGTQQHQSRPTPGPAPRPIPRPRNSFVGRTEEQAQLALAVGRSRLVTLVGPGGSGKTRLCLQLLQRSDLGFGDGRAFADLTASTDVTVHRDVAAAVGLPADHEDIEMHLAAALASRDMLLVLDNCEHVIEPVVKLVERLLADCPVLTILATSRQLLDVDGEECFSLSPLAVPSTGPPVGDPRSLLAYHSVALLLDRAQARNPGFRITNENAGAVAGLCRLLDGLPLAIELAAARLRSMTPNELAQGLDSPHTQPRSSTRQSPGNTLLSVPEGASAGRHRSLTAALQWSTDLLTSAELAVFRRFAVFVGGASSEQATQICYPDDPVRAADLLDGLVAKSLLRWECEVSCGMGRFAMHETVRRHAAELLASSGESAQIERAYAQAFVEFADATVVAMHSSREPAALQRLSNQNADLNSALNWVHSHEPAVALRLCSELWWYWFRTNRAADGMKHLTRTLLANPGSGCVYAQAVAGLGYLAWVLDDYPLAFRSARDVLNMDGLAPSVLGLAHGVLARAAGDSGDCTSAIAEATAGAYCYQKAGNAWGVAWSRRCQASAQLLAGNLTASRESCVASRRTFERLGDSWGAAGAIDMLSSLSNRTGHYREALVLAQEAVLRHRDLNDTSGTRYSLQHLGEAALGMGDLDVALNAATESLTLSRNYGYRNGELRAQLLRAEVARRKCDTGEQEQASRAAIILATQLDDATLLERARELLTAA